ncbi:MAG: DSD1 family PLP-dependent enzyme [Gammaproteobacteria bacterium]|nr:DSD1 family PLP-dependent enzyme [Gammaproteobacteria bacterium]
MSYTLAVQSLVARPWEPVRLAQPVPVDSLPTPALLLDEDAFERNVERMAEHLRDKGKGFRPHAKTHKCPIIAARQLAAGAVGVCAAKVSEAVVLINAGVGPVLITSAVATSGKAGVVAQLARQGQLSIVVDGDLSLRVLEEAVDEDVELGVLVDVDVDMGRTGTRDVADILRLAERVERHPNLRFEGIQHYAGHLMHVDGYQARRERSLGLWEKVAAIVAELGERGVSPTIVTGAGTGTFNIDCDVAELTDLQVGSYIFMDREYRLIGGEQGPLFDDFEVSLTVATTAISQPLAQTITVDGGYKAFASDTVNPEPLDLPGAKFRFGGDEHGILILPEGNQEPLLGKQQRFITPHCDPTVNLYDHYWVHRDGHAHSIWPIAARGCSW